MHGNSLSTGCERWAAAGPEALHEAAVCPSSTLRPSTARPSHAAALCPYRTPSARGAPAHLPACPSHRTASSRSRSGSPSSGRSPPAPRQACCGCIPPGGSPLSGPRAAAAGSLLRSPSPECPLSPPWPSAAATHGAYPEQRRSPPSASNAGCRRLIFSKRFLFSKGLSFPTCPHPTRLTPCWRKSRATRARISWQGQTALLLPALADVRPQMQIRFSFPLSADCSSLIAKRQVSRDGGERCFPACYAQLVLPTGWAMAAHKARGGR